MSQLIILGASTRAAAMSALRAGLTPWCADLFADADLVRIATVRKIAADAYPEGLLDALKDAPQAPVMYAGALENRPDLIERIERPLLGNPASVLRAVRSPKRWADCLRAHGLPCPRMSEEAQATGTWLLKPRRSAGGFGIHAYQGQAFNPRNFVLQERIEGMPVAAIFDANNKQARFCGVTEQLVGVNWLNARNYQYTGSLGPLRVDPAPWHALGAALMASFDLQGLFGVDAIVRDGVSWPVEINPRYTSSVEVIERSCKGALLSTSGIARAPTQVVGKAILYARKTFAFPAHGPWLDSLNESNLDAVEYADIPFPGEVIEQGRPVLTIFAGGSCMEECRRALQEKAQALDLRLWG
jgi:uncharacterized protein